jgi:SP family general alpha glucoside:H+ symporter-like MFS transporter
MSDMGDVKPHGDASQIEATAVHDHDLDEKAKVADYKADAIAAETAEHNMTVMESLRAYPMAAFWAFVMSFTIVGSSLLPL